MSEAKRALGPASTRAVVSEVVLGTQISILGTDAPTEEMYSSGSSAPAPSAEALLAEDPARVTDRPPRKPTSEKDKVRPYHAKEMTPGEEAAEVVAAVLKHAAERDEAAKTKAVPKQQTRWMLPLGLNLGVLAVYLLIAPPAWVEMNRIDPPPPEEVVANLQASVYIAKSKVEAYRSRNGGRLPVTLEEAGVNAVQAEAIGYTPRGDSTYVLLALVGDRNVTFDSARHTDQMFGNLAQRIGR
jgi:hypothetical protein